MSKATHHPPLHSPSERFRKPVSILLAIIFIVFLIFTAPLQCPWGGLIFEALGLFLVVLGVLGRLWCALYIAGHKDSVLRDDGPYSICRNPLYFFSFLGLIGITFYARMGLLAIIVGVLFKLYYHFVIQGETNRLKTLFGQPYLDYVKRTPCFFPNLKKYQSRKEITIEPARMLGAAKDVIWFFMALAFVGALNRLHDMGIIPTYWTWPF